MAAWLATGGCAIGWVGTLAAGVGDCAACAGLGELASPETGLKALLAAGLGEVATPWLAGNGDAA